MHVLDRIYIPKEGSAGELGPARKLSKGILSRWSDLVQQLCLH